MKVERIEYDYKCDFCGKQFTESGVGFNTNDNNIVLGVGQKVRWTEEEDLDKAQNHICTICLNNTVDLARNIKNKEKVYFNIKVIDYSY